MKNQKRTATTAVLLFMGLIIGSGAAMAAYTANPRNPTTYWLGANGVWQTDATFEARSAGQPTRYLKQTIPASKLTLGKLTKAAMGGPLNLAITAAIVGYAVWDSGTGEFYAPSDPTALNGYQDGYYWKTGLASASCGAQSGTGYWTSPEAYAKWAKDTYAACSGQQASGYYFTDTSTTSYKVWIDMTTTSDWAVFVDRVVANGQTLHDIPAEQKTDEQVADKILQDANLTKQILTDSIDRGTWRGGNWPEMQTAATAIAEALDRVDAGTATQDDLDLEQAALSAPATPATEPQALPDDYAREPTLQELRDHAATVAQNTATLADDGSQLPPWQPPTLPEDPVPDWDYTGQFTAFWDWAKGLFPFSFLLSPLTAFGGTAPPPLPDFSITVLGNSQTLSLQPVSVVFTWIRAANGILLLFGFYLIGLSIARRFI